MNQAQVDLNGLFVLDSIKRGVDIFTPNGRMEAIIDAWKQSLIRRGFLTEKGAITVTGHLLLTAVEEGIPFTRIKEMVNLGVEAVFDQWWKIYPATDIFEYKGKKFTGTRGLKTKKADCLLKFKKILSEGEVTSDDMIRALEYEILLKKEASFTEGENKLKYMQNSFTYLTQRTFDNFIEISKINKIAIKSRDNMDL